MIKGIKCDYCEEEILYEGFHLHLSGLDYYFHDIDCFDRWAEEHLELEDVVEPEDYNV